MKLRVLLPLLGGIVGPIIPPIDDPIYEKQDDFDYLEIPVFVDGKTNTITLIYSFKGLGSNDRYLNIYVPKYGDQGNEVNVYSEHFYDLCITRTIDIDYAFPANAKTVNMRFELSEYKTVKTNVTYPVPKRALGSTNIDKNNICTINKGAIVYSHKNGVSNSNESYEFENFFTTYSPLYSYLDISQLRFKYDGPIDVRGNVRSLNYEYVSLIVDDEDNLLSNVGHYDPPFIRSFYLRLKLAKDGYYHLFWNQKLYVDPLTLNMSDTMRDGYVETPYFYFPRGIDYAKTLECILFFRYMGVNQENFSIRFTVDKSTPVIGYCGVGSYCVTSTTGTPNFEIGESVTYS